MVPGVLQKDSVIYIYIYMGFPSGLAGKESAYNAGAWVQSLGWEDTLEKGKATHSSILAWKIHMCVRVCVCVCVCVCYYKTLKILTCGWGTHVNPWLIHVNVWQKPLQYCKVISLQLIKKNWGKEKRKKKENNYLCNTVNPCCLSISRIEVSLHKSHIPNLSSLFPL